MSLAACAELVQTGDPDRFAATMAAPPDARVRLWPIYAANLEIARAPWASAEPMVSEMRLQWWVDTIEGLASGVGRPGHAVTETLAPRLTADPALAALLTEIAEARRWDCWREAFEDRAAFDAYLDATAGNLMWAAARSLDAPDDAESTVRDFAYGAGLAGFLCAVPELEARGCIPFVDGRPAAIAALADEGRARIDAVRPQLRKLQRSVLPALWPGHSARSVLARAARVPSRVADGTLGPSGFAKRGGLLWRAFTGTI